ncbi:hypothetical protein [Adhaeribacter radiodurans]|uniref:Uncharacterized protein n=1 Tax=Adhaeribacter radiodurans TaxID=2745197 RepID=A0A7L7LE28_9BACT|nr:hypothetical protein [Adhaeribacter radiodurans]QMU31023.1 hypothetical protein HUW48_24685 [Adhaeribacter radiodurans]
MRFIIIALFITLPYFSFSQGQGKGKFKIKINEKEYDTDKSPDIVDEFFPQRIAKFKIKKEKNGDPTGRYVVLIGEEERTFQSDGEYHDVEFSHDIKELGIYILNEKRALAGKPFRLKKRK